MAKPISIINPTTKFANLVDGETTLKLAFTYNSLASAEAVTNQNLLKALDMNNMSISSVRALLYATLLTFHKNITLEKAGDILQRVGVASVIQKVIEAWSLSQPEPDPNAVSEEENEVELPATATS